MSTAPTLTSLRMGDHVKVTEIDVEIKGEVTKHPHAGKRGRITEFFGVYIPGPHPPRAMVKLDPDQQPKGHFIVVTVGYLEKIR